MHWHHCTSTSSCLMVSSVRQSISGALNILLCRSKQNIGSDLSTGKSRSGINHSTFTMQQFFGMFWNLKLIFYIVHYQYRVPVLFKLLITGAVFYRYQAYTCRTTDGMASYQAKINQLNQEQYPARA